MKIQLTVIIFLVCNISAFSQENAFSLDNKYAAGLGLEFNLDSRHYFAGAVVLAFDYNLNSNYSVGANLTASNNFAGFLVIEPTVMVRHYIWENCHRQIFFVQADLGALFFREDGEWTQMFELGLRGGFRMPIRTIYYIEPYGRLGYPFAWGIGFIVGRLF